MNDSGKTKKELLKEIQSLKKQIAALKSSSKKNIKKKNPGIKLNPSEEQFKHLVWDMQIGVILQGSKAEILMSNPKALELLGISEDQLLGKTSFDPDWNVIHEDGLPFPGETHPVPQAIALRKPVLNVVMGVYRPTTRSRVWLLVDAIPQLKKDKTVNQVICTFLDITERKKALEELEESEQRLARAEKITKIGNWKLMVNTKQIISSTGARIIYGVDRDTMSLEDIQKIPLREYRAFLDQALSDLINKNIPYNVEYKILRPNDGNIIDIHSNADYDKENNIVFGVVHDITERKKTEETLREQDNRYKLIAENTADTIWIRDMNLKLQYVSPSVKRIRGFSVDEALKQDISDLIAPESLKQMQNTYKTLLAKELDGSADPNAIYTIELEQLKKDGSSMWAENKVSVLRDENKKPIGILGITRDITERKLAEVEIKMKNENLLKLNSEKDKLFSIIAHDLRSPFQGLVGLTEIMAEHINSLSLTELSELCKGVNTSARNLLKLLRNLLDWAQMQQGTVSFDPQEIIFSELVQNNINLLQTKIQQKKIVVVQTFPHDQIIYADEGMLNSIMRNLLSNAAKFTPKEGEILISVKDQDDKFSLVTIADTGIGIPDQLIEKLFKIEEKVGRKGTEGEDSTGLGLLLCKEFVERHGGKIWVTSQEGKGSEFYFTLPKPTS